jgi:hypothetical protein
MGQHGGVKIAIDGLRNLYDFSNLSSYAGSGNTAYDLISNLHHSLVSVTAAGSGSSIALSFAGAGFSTYSINNMGISGGYSRTVSCWVKFNSASGNQAILGQGSSGTASAADLVRHDGIYKLFSGASYNSSGVGISTAGQWFFLTCVYAPFSVTLYINAVVAPAGLGFPLTSDSSLRFGVSVAPVTHPNLDGQLAMVQFYNRALTAVEVQKAYDATKKRFGI